MREVEEARAAHARGGGGRPRHPGHDRPRAGRRDLAPSTCRSTTCRSATWSASGSGLPVFVDNDANVAALAEHLYGAARGAQNAVMLTIGTGIGGGLILGGEIYRGTTGAGAELGHTVIDARRAALPGQLPRARLRRDARLGHGAGREGRAAAEREPDSALGRLLRRGRADRRQGGHRGGARRRRDGDRASSTWSARGSASRWPASPTSSSRR